MQVQASATAFLPQGGLYVCMDGLCREAVHALDDIQRTALSAVVHKTECSCLGQFELYVVTVFIDGQHVGLRVVACHADASYVHHIVDVADVLIHLVVASLQFVGILLDLPV